TGNLLVLEKISAANIIDLGIKGNLTVNGPIKASKNIQKIEVGGNLSVDESVSAGDTIKLLDVGGDLTVKEWVIADSIDNIVVGGKATVGVGIKSRDGNIGKIEVKKDLSAQVRSVGSIDTISVGGNFTTSKVGALVRAEDQINIIDAKGDIGIGVAA